MNVRIDTIGVPRIYLDLETRKYYCIAEIVEDEENKTITLSEEKALKKELKK